jgi:hypothetical protein
MIKTLLKYYFKFFYDLPKHFVRRYVLSVDTFCPPIHFVRRYILSADTFCLPIHFVDDMYVMSPMHFVADTFCLPIDFVADKFWADTFCPDMFCRRYVLSRYVLSMYPDRAPKKYLNLAENLRRYSRFLKNLQQVMTQHCIIQHWVKF